MSNNIGREKVIRQVFPQNSPRISINDEYKNYNLALQEYEKKAIESFVIENYLCETNEIYTWFYLYKIKYELNSPLNIFEFLGNIQRLFNNEDSYLEYYYNQIYFIESDPIKIQDVNLEINTINLRKIAFKDNPYLKTLFPEVTIWE